MYRVFYNIMRLGEVPADDPIEMDIADVYSEVFPLLKEDREFIGLIDTDGTTLQVMYDANKSEYWFEVPRPDLEGSYGKLLSFDEALELMKSLSWSFPTEGLNGFEFQRWRG